MRAAILCLLLPWVAGVAGDGKKKDGGRKPDDPPSIECIAPCNAASDPAKCKAGGTLCKWSVEAWKPSHWHLNNTRTHQPCINCEHCDANKPNEHTNDCKHCQCLYPKNGEPSKCQRDVDSCTWFIVVKRDTKLTCIIPTKSKSKDTQCYDAEDDGFEGLEQRPLCGTRSLLNCSNEKAKGEKGTQCSCKSKEGKECNARDKECHWTVGDRRTDPAQPCFLYKPKPKKVEKAADKTECRTGYDNTSCSTSGDDWCEVDGAICECHKSPAQPCRLGDQGCTWHFPRGAHMRPSDPPQPCTPSVFFDDSPQAAAALHKCTKASGEECGLEDDAGACRDREKLRCKCICCEEGWGAACSAGPDACTFHTAGGVDTGQLCQAAGAFAPLDVPLMAVFIFVINVFQCI